MKFDRQNLLRASVLVVLTAGAWTAGCGAESPDVPGDDEEGGTTGMGGASGTGFGGAGPQGGANTGGAFPTGGANTGGAFPTGGANTGGAFPTGGATTGGATATGGASTSPCLTNNVGAATDLLIDNLEDGNNTVGDDKMPPVRIGYWYTFKDTVATCMAMPTPDPTGAIPFLPAAGMGNMASTGARLSGTGCTGPDYAAGMGFDVNNCMSAPKSYNASAYHGITFWYKSTTAVRFQIGTVATTPPPNGTCAAMCYDHHGSSLLAASSGMTVNLPFNMLNQEFTTTMTAFDATQVLNFQWQVKKEDGASFDVTVDDISFTP